MALVSGRGLLLPGDDGAGVGAAGLLRYRGRHYAFSSLGRARRFGADPAGFVVAAARLVRECPCLENLLGGAYT